VTTGIEFARGDGFELLGAFFWAGQIQLLAKFAPSMDAVRLSFIQALFASLISFGVGFVREPFDLAALGAAFWPILYGGVVSIGIAYTMQVIAQQSARPTAAAIILSLESVFAALWGWLFLKEILSPRGLLGSGLMLMGMILSQIRIRSGEGQSRHISP
jgi:drug/metabolite transporter (DMT)-like permease